MPNVFPAKNERQLRRRHKRERQAVVFGLLIAVMAVLGLGAVAVYSGTVSAPFAVPFASASPAPGTLTTPPCLAKKKSTPVPYRKIKVNVFNASNRPGLASATASDLRKRGFKVKKVSNSRLPVAGVRISFGRKGLTRAYTLLSHFTDAHLFYDARKNRSTDVILGPKSGDLVAEDDVELEADTPMESLPGCSPIDQLTPAAAPVKTSKTDDDS